MGKGLWSKQVTLRSNSLDLEEEVFIPNAENKGILRSIKAAKNELRKLFGRDKLIR